MDLCHEDQWICTEPLLPLEMQIQNKFIPAIKGRHPAWEVERLKAFRTNTPTRGLETVNPLNMKSEYKHSKTVSTPLVNLIIRQQVEVGTVPHGSSSWLTTLPLQQREFCLHKSAFGDTLYLRYGWWPMHLPDPCPCGAPFTVDHSL